MTDKVSFCLTPLPGTSLPPHSIPKSIHFNDMESTSDRAAVDDLVWIARLPISVLSDIVLSCPFVYWGRFVMSCKGVYELFAKDVDVGEVIYRKITLGPDSGILAAAIRRNKDSPTLTLSGLSNFLAHTRELAIISVKGFDDFYLRQLQTFSPLVVNLTLSNLPEVRGKLGLLPSPQELDINEEATQAEASVALSNPVPFVRPPSALELWVSQLTSLQLYTVHVRDSYLARLVPRVTRLEVLNLSSSLIQSALSVLGPHLTSLRHLTLDGSWKLRHTDLEAWALHAPAQLQTLSLKSCEHLSDLALTRLLARCGPSLKTFNIKFNTNVSELGLDAIRLKANPRMTSISVSNLSPLISSRTWRAAVSVWTDVKYLDLSLNPGINDEVIEAVAETCKSVSNLNLRATSITDAAIQSISGGLSCLKFLDTSACALLTGFPGLGQIGGLLRLSSPEIKTLNISLLIPQFAQMGSNLKFINKYDLSWTNITDECIELILQQAFWLNHLSVISCTALTNRSVDAVTKLLSHPHYTSPFFSLGICKTPLITDWALFALKMKFAYASLVRYNDASTISSFAAEPSSSSSSSSPSPSSSASSPTGDSSSGNDSGQDTTFIANDAVLSSATSSALIEDRMSIACRRGGKTKPHGLCQCTLSGRKRTTSVNRPTQL